MQIFILEFGLDSHYNDNTNITKNTIYSTLEDAYAKAITYGENAPTIVKFDLISRKTISNSSIDSIKNQIENLNAWRG
jgi:hypothetical protein